MPTLRQPRSGSLQYWPRKRAQRQHARIRSWKPESEAKPLGFAGFKAGMTHIFVTDNRKNSPTKGQDIRVPVTIVECPPLVVAGVRFYKQSVEAYGEVAATEVHFKPGKHLPRTTSWKASGDLEKINAEEYSRAMLLVHTEPVKTGIGQKKPQIFELAVGGSVADVIAFAKENKEISVDAALAAGQFVDAHAVSTGKGFQGVVKRMGVGLRSHKSEKKIRAAVIAPEGYGRVSFRAPQAGQMGYHLRTEYNKQVMAIVPAEEVQISGGIVNFGNVKNTVVLVKGSVPGPKKRLITLTHATRKDPKKSEQAMELVSVSTRSQQGNQ